MDKKYYKYDIPSMDRLLKDYVYKEDYFYKTEIKTPDYMEKCSVLRNIGMFFSLVGRLVYRMTPWGRG